jgi:GNAT superfamily N-acetyltransferase
MSNHADSLEESLDLNALEFRTGLDGLTPSRIATLYRRAPLLRPIVDVDALWRMFEKSDLVITAWHRGHLAGIARVLTDGVLNSYLCDLAVEPDVQGLGVGKRLIDEVMKVCRGTELMLRDSDLSAGFYEHIGFSRVTNAWVRQSQ